MTDCNGRVGHGNDQDMINEVVDVEAIMRRGFEDRSWEQDKTQAIGPYGKDKENNNGQMFRETLEKAGMWGVSTCIKKNKWTTQNSLPQ